ncbi:MAG: hypothetical protein A3A44_02825 [Candidatus Sungbacteria bacterium RIFCSPLOWO2_01_FULL_60_25]|uniref:Uncharacterized protein n=1 Tax=Candidatus Sungbacteria bacterium RIFCSPLOWO2_01_FULL_60_25 TaxID=1802281 RepID=A0A1G2LGC2_9BACT|nr:MAG: hypothetical protein A3A44_02825 [Candidatus Sungbacteria bacterium RIFCSPLOWO2_01_FULL_60_25]
MAREEYFVLVHGHLCGISCPGDGKCASQESFLAKISEVAEGDPAALFDRQENEGVRDAHVLRTGAKTLFEASSLRQDCVGNNGLIRVITRSEWETRRQVPGETIPIGMAPLGMTHLVSPQACP